MGCRILAENGNGRTVLYCSTTMWAFGPVFRDAEEAAAFLNWLRETPNEEMMAVPLLKRDDPRSYSEKSLETLYSKFLVFDQWRKEHQG